MRFKRIGFEWFALALMGGAGVLFSACGSDTPEESTFDGNGGSSASAGSGGSSAAGGQLDGGTDSFIDPDSGDSSFDPDSDTCAWDTKEPKRAGIDIIFAIDNSHSMGDEIQKTLSNINAFADAIATSGLDYQVIMVSAKGTNLTDMSEAVPNLKGSGLTGDMPLEVCVPPPLGVGANGADPCGDNDPIFHHLDHWPFGIASNNGMWLAGATYNEYYTWPNDAGPPGGGWAQWARYDAMKYFVVVTDDDAEVPTPDMGDPSVVGTATEPYEVMDRLLLHDDRFGPPGMFGDETNRKYVYNTVCGWTYPGGESTDPEDGGGCRTAYTDPDYNQAMNPGEQHQKLAQLTGGIVESICRDDWTAVLGKISDEIIETLGCEFGLPEPDTGTLNPNEVLVRYTPAGEDPTDLTRVTDASKCADYENAWYYDDNDEPAKIILCPDACATIGTAHTGQLDVLMGCTAPPPK